MKTHRNIMTMALLCSAFLAGACGDTINNYYGSEDDPSDGGGTTNPPVTDNTENTQARCSDGIDNDGNGKSDCDDPNCFDFTFCAKTEAGKENTLAACADGEDNDGDGKTDCDDTECKQFMICQEKVAENTEATCKDGLDNDGDGNIDCEDSECKAFSMCSSAPSKPAETEDTLAACLDGKDNDGDGKTDCEDSECKVFAICQGSTETPENPGKSEATENTLVECTDGIDNDGDGDLDCLDTECHVFDICKSAVGVKENTRELCSDGLDNDFNGVADAQDPNCALFVNGGGAYGENYDSCKNKSDIDGDGKKGCDDPECSIYDVCMKDYSATKDECPDDPFKFKKDSCACGETSVDGVCYTNIASATEFFSKITSKPSGKFIIKQPIDLGESNHAPITGFSGVLDGGGHRITGVLNQDVSKSEDATPACGLFGRLIANPDVTFKNIDLAITLNCTGATGKPLVAGGLAAELKGNANHITGSSKVYVETADYTTIASSLSRLDRDIGGLFGNTNYKESNISDIKLRGNVSAYYYTYINVKLMRDRIGGLVGAGNVLRNIDADVNVTLNSRNTNPNTWIRTFVGGVAGRASLLDQVHSRGYIKQVGEERTNNYVDWAFTAGVAGYIDEGASNVSFNGTIEVSGYPVSLIEEQKKYIPSSGSTKYYDAWIGYGKDYTSDKEDAYSHPKNYGNHIGGIAAVLGSVVEGDFSASEYDENTKIFKAGIEQAVVDADFYVIANNVSVGGILGSMMNTNTFVRNSSANIGMTFLRNNETRNNDTNVTRSCYYGGIVGLTIGESYNLNPVSYVINNSARTRHYANNGQLNNEALYIGGITGGTYGVLVNNFASDTIYCGESCAYSLSAVKGAYVYESYWNKDVVGTNSGAYYSDASAQPYTYNASGIPVTRTQASVLGLLRYNAGYDGGVLSANIPANADGKYLNWTTTTDEEGHSIPVPMIK